MLQQFEVIAHY